MLSCLFIRAVNHLDVLGVAMGHEIVVVTLSRCRNSLMIQCTVKSIFAAADRTAIVFSVCIVAWVRECVAGVGEDSGA